MLCGHRQPAHASNATPCVMTGSRLLVRLPLLAAVFQAERDSERFALYARKAALDERAEEIRQQLKVCGPY